MCVPHHYESARLAEMLKADELQTPQHPVPDFYLPHDSDRRMVSLVYGVSPSGR